MREHLLSVLASPCCLSGLVAVVTEKRIYGDVGPEEIVQGVLTCTQCRTQYPVIDGIPRLCKTLTPGEEEELSRILDIKTPVVRREPARNGDVDYDVIRKAVLERMKRPRTENPYLIRRWENDVEYKIKHCEEQEKFIGTLRLHHDGSFKSILDIGAGPGGLMKCLKRHYPGAGVIALDNDLKWAEVVKLRNPGAEVVRGDATSMPFKTGSIDCVFSTSVLEHICDYDQALREMCRVCREVLFVAWVPNKLSVYDFGHLDAPVAIFPKSIGKWVALLWHRLRRTGRPTRTIFSELEHTHYISTTHVKRFLLQYGTVKNVFVDFALFSLQSKYAYRMGRLKRFLSAHMRLSRLLFRLMTLLRIEPQCYYLLKRH
jgi:uncharacterized protein YbaR (Trm112 family)/SAM-dependent methyltransferase